MGAIVLPSIIFFSLLLFEDVATSPITNPAQLIATSTEDSQNVVEALKCFRYLQESGKRIFIGYVGTTNAMRLFDSEGIEVSCDETEQQRLRQKSDRRCIFSPIHCLFNKRLLKAKLLSKTPKFANQMTNRLYFLRRK